MYDEDQVAEILAELSKGRTLLAICAAEHLPCRTTFLTWVADDREGISDRYHRAQELGAAAMVEEALSIADDSSGDERVTSRGNVVLDTEFAQRSKLRVDTRLRIAALLDRKWSPQKKVEHSGAVEHRQRIEHIRVVAAAPSTNGTAPRKNGKAPKPAKIQSRVRA